MFDNVKSFKTGINSMYLFYLFMLYIAAITQGIVYCDVTVM